MNKKEKNPEYLSNLNINDLREKQSVRTTFKLSRNAHEVLAWLSKYRKITIKEVFDVFCKTDDVLPLGDPKEINKSKTKDTNRTIRKTYVISKHALRILKNYSKENDIPRDLLVENFVLFWKVLIEEKNETTLEKHKKALEILSQYFEDGEGMLSEVLDFEDPIMHEFSLVIGHLDMLIGAIEYEMKTGEPIDITDLLDGRLL